MRLTKNDTRLVYNLLRTGRTYEEVTVYLSIDVKDIKLIAVLLLPDFELIANQFNKLRSK